MRRASRGRAPPGSAGARSTSWWPRSRSRSPGARDGPVLPAEPRVLAVAAAHPLAGRASVSLDVLAEVPLIQLPDEVSREFRDDRTPCFTPSGQPTLKGPECDGLSNILTTIALAGVCTRSVRTSRGTTPDPTSRTSRCTTPRP
ncbi:LysR substrate-binding domain-containing protein [Streptomyces buecherae]|uniref:LysR substrate-binding domain-containing protein n=1 Tax=Streptomyces buecherae TaxID=2763006 RepID=UPI0036BD3BE4